MKSIKLPIALCTARCLKCKMPTEVRMFENGAGGDFSTFIGKRTGAFYRIDNLKIMYLGATESKLLEPAILIEESLIKVPEEVTCKICGSILGKSDIYFSTDEELIDAFEL